MLENMVELFWECVRCFGDSEVGEGLGRIGRIITILRKRSETSGDMVFYSENSMLLTSSLGNHLRKCL